MEDPSEKTFEQIDIHFDQGNGVTQTTLRRKKALEAVQQSNAKPPAKGSTSPLPRRNRTEDSDRQDQAKQVEYGTFGGKANTLNQIRAGKITQEK